MFKVHFTKKKTNIRNILKAKKKKKFHDEKNIVPLND